MLQAPCLPTAHQQLVDPRSHGTRKTSSSAICLPTARQQLMQQGPLQRQQDVIQCLGWQVWIALACPQPTLKLTSSWSSKGHNSARRTSSSASGGRAAPAAMAPTAHCWSVSLVAWRGCSQVHRHSCKQDSTRLPVP